MRHQLLSTSAAGVILSALLALPMPAQAGQAPVAADAPDIPISSRDRIYAAEQFSNTVSVTDPAANKLLGLIRLGEPQPAILARCIRVKCSCMAWVSRPITRRSPWSRSARTP